MGTTKTKKTDKKNKVDGSKSPLKESGDKATGAAKIARKLLDKLPAITAPTRAALRALATDAQRSGAVPGNWRAVPGKLARGREEHPQGRR